MKFLITLLFLGQAVIITFIGTLITRAEARQLTPPGVFEKATLDIFAVNSIVSRD
jgi:hypothetical protein